MTRWTVIWASEPAGIGTCTTPLSILVSSLQPRPHLHCPDTHHTLPRALFPFPRQTTTAYTHPCERHAPLCQTRVAVGARGLRADGRAVDGRVAASAVVREVIALPRRAWVAEALTLQCSPQQLFQTPHHTKRDDTTQRHTTPHQHRAKQFSSRTTQTCEHVARCRARAFAEPPLPHSVHSQSHMHMIDMHGAYSDCCSARGGGDKRRQRHERQVQRGQKCPSPLPTCQARACAPRAAPPPRSHMAK